MKFKVGQYWKNEEAVVAITFVGTDGQIVGYTDLITKKESSFYGNSGFACNLKLLNKLEVALYSPVPKKKRKKRKQ